jgi:hypothetical protein
MITAKGLIQLGFNPLDDFVLQDDGNGPYIKEWNSNKPRPTVADVEAAHAAWENDYVRKRLEEYPSIEELTVALWEGVVEERMAAVTKLEGKRQAVKTKHPK